MAWLDFMKAIRQQEDDPRKRHGVVGGFLNAVDTGENAVRGTARKIADATDHNDSNYNFFDVARDLPSAAIDATKKVGSDIGNFAADTAQGAARGVVNTALTLKEGDKSSQLDKRNATIDNILNIPEAQREKILNDKNDPRFETLRLAKKQLGGDLSDKALVVRKASNTQQRGQHETYKANNPIAKFLIGSEGGETAQSAQATTQQAHQFLNKEGVNPAVAGFLAPLAGGANAALDLPTGVGSLVKGIGKQGIKELVKEGTQDGAQQILKSHLPSLSDDMLRQLAPRLAEATDARSVTKVLEDAGRYAIKPIAAPLSSIRGTTKGTVDMAQSFIDNIRPGAAKPAVNEAADTLDNITIPPQARPRPDDIPGDIAAPPAGAGGIPPATPPITPPGSSKPGDYGQAADELLGRFKHQSELEGMNKPGFKQSFKEQFVDKLSPVHDMVSTIEQRTGKTFKTEDNPYELMRLYQGMPDQVQQRVQGLADILRQSPDLNAVKIIGSGRQMLDRSSRGITNTISDDKIREAINGVHAKLGPEGFDKAASVVDAVNEYNNGLLDDLHGAGILSDDAVRAINEVGGNYFSKLNVIDHILQNDQNRALFSSGGSYNVTKQAVNKIVTGAKGMGEGSELLDPVESIVRATDSSMRAIAKNDIWHSFNRLADEAPDLVQRIREPENVTQRINLSLENKELRPVRNKLDRLISTRGSWVRSLESQINGLEKRGLNLSLRKGGDRMANQGFDVGGLGGRVATSKAGSPVPLAPGEKKVMDLLGQVTPNNPNKLGPSDTGSFVRNLIEQGSRSDIDKIKKMVGNRDEKMTNLLDEIGSLKSEYDDVAGTVRENSGKIKDLADANVPEGMKLISGFGEGQQGKLAVPADIADVFSGKSKAQQDYLTSMMGTINGFVKQNFTSNNPAFALMTNPLRDAKSFAYNAEDVKADPYHIGKALVDGLVTRVFKKGDIYDRWVKAGGRSGFYSDERTAETLAKDLSREIRNKRVLGVRVGEVHNAKDLMREATRVLSAPLRVPRDALHGAGSILEDAPRIAQFKASLNADKTDAEAAFKSRNVTVDFQRSGRIGQTVNAWIPFLNARAQGTLKTVEAIRKNPARAAAVYAGLTATPILLTAMNNEAHPDVLKMIPQTDRDNNFVIIFGDAKDENGNFTQVVKIPKADVDKVLGNPLENFARWVAHDDPRTLGEVITNMIGAASPVDIVRDDRFSGERTLSGVLPPILKAPLESVTNRNLYFGSDIVPQNMQGLPNSEQVRADDPNTPQHERATSPVASFISKLTGGSPIKTENTLRSFTGNLLTEKPQDQVGGNLSGATSNQMNNEFYKVVNVTTKNKNSASNHINDAIARGDYAEAQKTAQTYNAYLRDQFAPFAQRYGNQMTPELAQLYEQQKIVLTQRSIAQRQRNQLERQAAQ